MENFLKILYVEFLSIMMILSDCCMVHEMIFSFDSIRYVIRILFGPFEKITVLWWNQNYENF